MKKIIYIALAVSALILTCACERKGTIYDMPAGSALVSFPSDAAIFEMVAEDGNKITVDLWRGNTKGAASVAFQVEDKTGGVFKPAKSTFDFADGEGVAHLDITYPNIKDFGGETYELVLKIADEEQVSPSGIDKMTISATRKLTPKFVGTGIYYSDWYEEEWEQDLYTTEEAPDFFILPDCWVKGTDFTFTIQNHQPVWPSVFFSGYVHSSYGNVNLHTGEVVVEDTDDGRKVMYIQITGYRVSAGSFGSGWEYFVFPAGFNL
jgi:hypothetical protein